MTRSEAEAHADIVKAVIDALYGDGPFFFAWLHTDGTVRYAVYQATPALAIQAVNAFVAACQAPTGQGIQAPAPADQTV